MTLSSSQLLFPLLLLLTHTNHDTKWVMGMFSARIIIARIIYSFGEEFIQLSFTIDLSPKTNHFRLWTKCHIHEFFIPTTIINFTQSTSKNNTIIPNLIKLSSQIIESKFVLLTSMESISPVLSVPQCTAKLCFCNKRLRAGRRSTSFPF